MRKTMRIQILLLGALAWVTTWSMAETPVEVDKEQEVQESKKYLEKFEKLTPDMARGHIGFEVCALCHTPEGWGSKNGRYPQIAGQHASVIIKQLEDIRSGNRDNPTMYPFTQFEDHDHGVQKIVDIAAYVSRLPMSPDVTHGNGRHLEEGEQLYRDLCVKCHGEHGEGIADKYYPRIQGQNYRYLLRQMRWIQQNKRRNADLKMKRQIDRLSDRDLRAMADYVSRIKPDPSLVAKEGWRNPDFSDKFVDARKRKGSGFGWRFFSN
jgi:cytochrome c553